MVATAVTQALQVGLLSHDVGAGPAMPTAVAHFYEIQAAGALGEVSEFCEVPAGGWFLQSVPSTKGTAAPWLLHHHFTLGTGEAGAVSGAEALPTEAEAAVTGLLPFRSRQVETPMVPAFAVVFGNTTAGPAAEVPGLTHTAWSPCLGAAVPRQCRVHFRACLFARPWLPWGHMLPYFPGRAPLTVGEGAGEGSTLTGAVRAVPGEHSPWGQLPGLFFQG